MFLFTRALLLLACCAAPLAHAAYTVNADGTVTDTTTGLVWDQCVLGSRTSPATSCAANTNSTYTWANALNEVSARNSANHLGYSDWRLPNINELESLVDTTAATAPTINTTAFPNTPVTGDSGGGNSHWSSTSFSSSDAWFVYFNGGLISSDAKTGSLFVRLVRRGQSFSAFDALTPPIHGACGSAHDPALLTSAPSANLCSAGTPTVMMTGNSSYTWGCNGSHDSNGGTSTAADACSAGHGYTVTASAGLNGSISPSGAQVVAYNTTPTDFTVTPNSGYTASVGGTCGGSLVGNSYTTGAITADCTVSASFTLNTYAITATASPLAGGSVSCSPNPVSHGGNATCTATPNAGYTFGSWSGDCTGSGACSLSNVTGTRAVTAQFTLNTYAVTPTASPMVGGSVSCSPNPVSHGSTATCTATPSTGYTFSAWSGDCAGTGACSLGNVTSAKTVTAQFTLNTYAITATASPLAGGSVSCSPNPVNHGSNSTCTATPNAGYTFSTWSGDCTGSGACSLSNVTGTRAVTAQFIPVVNGACGSAANTSSAYTPASANLCASNGGTASAVTAGTSSWSWTCTGSSNGGTNASCSAPFAPTQGGGGTVGAIQANSTNGWQIDTANSGFVSAPAAAPAGVTLSNVTKVKLTGGTQGSQATVVLHFSNIPAGAQLYKYGKETGPTDANKWFAFPATIDRAAGTVTYVLTDGQKGDNDWTQNGVIDDPVGLGVGADVSGVPTLSEWALLLLAGLMGVATALGAGSLRRQPSP